MTDKRFASYARNHEDVLLWRVFRSFSTGTYIDIGAVDPECDSLTKAFHDRGWRGINCQPLPDRLERFRITRSQDLNLPILIGDVRSRMRLYTGDRHGPPFTFDEESSQFWRRSGRVVATLDVEVRPIDEIVAESGWPEIHFLRIDLSSSPPDAWTALCKSFCRPWIIVATSGTAGFPTVGMDESDRKLERPGYKQVYDNGFCRFLLREDRVDEFAAMLAIPPSTADEFSTLRERELEQQLAVYAGAGIHPNASPLVRASMLADDAAVADLRQRNFEMARRINELEAALGRVKVSGFREQALRILGAPGREVQRVLRRLRKRFVHA